VFVGNKSGLNNQKGFNNVYIGSECGYNSKSSASNVFIGYKSGYNGSATEDFIVSHATDPVSSIDYRQVLNVKDENVFAVTLNVTYTNVFGTFELTTIPHHPFRIDEYVYRPSIENTLSMYSAINETNYLLF
jgi:hypothetical protein